MRRRNLKVCAEKPLACQTVGRRLKIQIRRTKGEALSARWDPVGRHLSRREGKKKKGRRGAETRWVAEEEHAFEKKRRLIMGANPPRLDLETRRGSFVLEFVSFEISSEFFFRHENYGLFRDTLTNRRRVDEHSSRYWRINLSVVLFRTLNGICLPGSRFYSGFYVFENKGTTSQRNEEGKIVVILSSLVESEDNRGSGNEIKKKFPRDGGKEGNADSLIVTKF